MPDPTTPTRLTDRKRTAIVKAAIAEFREHGFAGTSMDRVAAVAEVSKRTVYNHFPSKEELFEAILLHLWDRSHALPAVRYDPARPLQEQLRAVLDTKMCLLDDPSFIALCRVAMAEMMHSPERARAMVARLSEKEEDLPVWIRAAQADGRLRAGVDPQYAAHQLHGMVKAFAFWPQLALGQPPLTAVQREQVLADAVAMFLALHAVPARRRGSR